MSQWNKSLNRKQENGKPIFDGVMECVVLAAECLVKVAEKQDIKVVITQGMRTKEYQDKLYAQGRTTPGAVVTRTRGGQSPHNHGLAFDFAVEVNGTISWTFTHAWAKVGEIAESMGLTWGGAWKNFVDNPHCEYTKGLTPRQWQSGVKVSPGYQIELCQGIWKVANEHGIVDVKNKAHLLAEKLRM